MTEQHRGTHNAFLRSSVLYSELNNQAVWNGTLYVICGGYSILIYLCRFLLLWTSTNNLLTIYIYFHKLLKQSLPLQVVYKPQGVSV